ncbi:MAG TPA: hypothetical protein V6C81_21325 [Planktothrix sp.]
MFSVNQQSTTSPQTVSFLRDYWHVVVSVNNDATGGVFVNFDDDATTGNYLIDPGEKLVYHGSRPLSQMSFLGQGNDAVVSVIAY